MAETNDNKCYSKAVARGQRTFTLIEQDASFSKSVAFWILLNIETCPAPKLRQALRGRNRSADLPRQEDSGLKVLYDTGKMGTPEHRARVERDLDAIQKEFQHVSRSDALWLNILRGTAKVSTTAQGTSGEMKRYNRACYKLKVSH